jgi:hypothetical protein
MRRADASWRGCALTMFSEQRCRVRFYPEEARDRARDVTADAAGLAAGQWRRLEASWLGTALLLQIDGRAVTRAEGLDPAASGDTFLLAFDTGQGALELRNVELCPADRQASAEGGLVTGLVVDRDRDGQWLDFRADSGGAAERYVPLDSGGAPLPATIEALRRTPTPNRATLVWKQLGGKRRITAVWLDLPAEKSGSTTGRVRDRGTGEGMFTWLDLEPDGGGPVERYVPRWLEGGMEKSIVQVILALKPGERVKVEWIFDIRRRAVRIEPVR